MDLIISSIESTLNSPDLRNAPVMIYVGVGTFAGLMTEIDGQKILEDKNYHQFPPCVQKIFSEHNEMHIFIILIDPLQENPLYISTDRNMYRKYFQYEWNHIDDTVEMYINDRITIYPFRKAVKTQINNYHYDDSILDITHELYRLNELCIQNDLTFLFHDFSGQDTPKLLEKYFIDQIKNNLDHIIYGIGGGYINGCYYDFTSPEAFFATTVEFKSRKIIKVFSIIQMMNQFHFMRKSHINTNLQDYLSSEIERYGIENIETISSQISNLKEDFKFKFKNYIIYILRILKDYNFDSLEDGKILDLNYYLKRINTYEIRMMIDSRDPQLFEKTIHFIGKMYENEITLITSNTRYAEFSPVELILMVTANSDKYKWFDTFNQIFN